MKPAPWPVRPATVSLRAAMELPALPTARERPHSSGPHVEAGPVSGPSAVNETPITDREQLVEFLAGGSKPMRRLAHRHRAREVRLPSRRSASADLGRRARHRRAARRHDALRLGAGDRARQADRAHARDASVTLEPGGQLELSGAPLRTIHETCCEVTSHLNEVKAVADELGLGFLGMGFQPKWSRDDMPWMPKGRYAIMRRLHAARSASLGLDMMTRTCTVQVNLDYRQRSRHGEEVPRRRSRCSRSRPRCSPIRRSPKASRTAIRAIARTSGPTPIRAAPACSISSSRTAWVSSATSTTCSTCRCISVYRDGKYIDLAGKSFRDFLAGKLPELPGAMPTLKDWADHMTTAFPEVRLKTYLEMRGADGGPWNRLCALPAFWVGLLYDRPRSMRRGTWSRISRAPNAMRCATACRSTRSSCRFAAAPCAISRSRR